MYNTKKDAKYILYVKVTGLYEKYKRDPWGLGVNIQRKPGGLLAL